MSVGALYASKRGSFMLQITDVFDLVDCLSQIPPVELQAVKLLNDLRLTTLGGWFPTVPPESVVNTTREIIDYTKLCAALLEKLTSLAPVILSTVEILEWPL
jgi:hypothetical protein